MTEEEKIALIRILIGDVETSPFYPLFGDEELQKLLNLAKGDVQSAARLAAISASMQLAGYNTKERTGDIEVWNSVSTSYLKALDYFMKSPATTTLGALYPWSGKADSCPSLVDINKCDKDRGCGSTCKTGSSYF